jgi:hypothetical protein
LYESIVVNKMWLAGNLVEDLRKDMTNDNRLVSSTLVQYGVDRDDKSRCRIVHHDGCREPALIKKIVCIVPEYDWDPISDVLDTKQGLNFMRKYFGTDDDKKTMIDILRFISGKSLDEILVTTGPSIVRWPSNDHTNNKIGSLEYVDDCFNIDATLSRSDAGRCRGVKYTQKVNE